MSRIGVLNGVFLFAAAVFAVVLVLRPSSAVPPVDAPSETSATSAFPDGTMMTTDAEGTPVFGFPDQLSVARSFAEPPREIIDVDRIYAEVDPPVLGTLQSSPGSICATHLSSRTASPAMVALRLLSPCDPEVRFVVRHGAVAFSVITDANGLVEVTVPALDIKSGFAAFLDNIEVAATSVTVAELADFDRIALSWQTPEEINMHAFEEGAVIRGPGHVWRAQPGSVEDLIAGTSGHLFNSIDKVGTPPANVEIFTFPAGRRAAAGDTTLRIGNLLNHRNCGREIDMVAVEVYGVIAPVVTPISPKMPSCDQIGNIVLLAKDLPTLIAEAR